MSKIFNNILETIGNTPLVRINKLNPNNSELLAKVEFFNPGGSVKDRVALAMIEDAEKRGLLKQGGTIIEPTSGNTGIGLALVSAIKGYKVILTMPETMSIERRKLLSAYGATIVLTEGARGMSGAIAKAEELQKSTSNSFMPQQFENFSNPQAHYLSTAQEILNDTENKIDAFVAGVGTGGTISGVAKLLKEKNPNVKIFAIEPIESAVLSNEKANPHKLQGIGAGFIPKILDRNLIDEVVKVKYDDAEFMLNEAATKEGLLIGISAGAALFAAVNIAKRQDFIGKRIVVLLPDTGERYLSRL